MVLLKYVKLSIKCFIIYFEMLIKKKCIEVFYYIFLSEYDRVGWENMYID